MPATWIKKKPKGMVTLGGAERELTAVSLVRFGNSVNRLEIEEVGDFAAKTFSPSDNCHSIHHSILLTPLVVFPDMTSRSSLHSLDVDKLRRNMSFPVHREDMKQEISKTITRCHFEKLRQITVQLGKERQRAIEEKCKGIPISDRQASLMSCETSWRMVIAEYNKDLRQSAFLFAAFNLLEDSIRVALLEKYRLEHGVDDWHKDDSKWPNWVRQKYFGSREHAKLTSLDSSRVFFESLSFGELIAFIYDSTAWNSIGCSNLFKNKCHPTSRQPLKDLSRCGAFERLKILQERRNLVFHHKPIHKEYYRPLERSGLPDSCDSNRGKKFTDGNAKNTLERIVDILNYLDVNGDDILNNIAQGKRTF